MHPTASDVLADLQRQVVALQVAPCEVDERVADALGVSPGDYATYLAVGSAIDRLARETGLQLQLPLDPPGGGPLAQAWTLTETIAASAAGICLEAADEDHRELYCRAARIHQAGERLREVVCELERHPDRVEAVERAALAAAAAPDGGGQ